MWIQSDFFSVFYRKLIFLLPEVLVLCIVYIVYAENAGDPGRT